jgi:hypothetical protein
MVFGIVDELSVVLVSSCIQCTPQINLRLIGLWSDGLKNPSLFLNQIPKSAVPSLPQNHITLLLPLPF